MEGLTPKERRAFIKWIAKIVRPLTDKESNAFFVGVLVDQTVPTPPKKEELMN